MFNKNDLTKEYYLAVPVAPPLCWQPWSMFKPQVWSDNL